MTMAADKQDKVLNFSSEREQSGACSSSAEHEKNQGRNFLNVPTLRFPEFTGEWNCYRLGDLTDLFSVRNKDGKNYPMFSVTNDMGFVPQSEKFEDREMIGENINNYKVIRQGDFAYNPARINVGSIARYQEDYPCMISSLYVCFKPDEQLVNSDLLLHILKSPRLIDKYKLHGEGGVRIYLFYPNFAQIKIWLPRLTEQSKIAKFLTLIEERITTQIRIIEELKLFRDTLMFKLLSPRKNWEHVCIHDVAMVVGGGTPDTNVKEYWDGNIQWFTPSEIGKEKYVIASERTISQAGLDNSSAKLLPANTILLSTRATIGECSIVKQECCTNQGFQSLIATTVTPEFLYYLIQTKKRDLLSKASGSTFSEISANEVRKIRVCIPTTAKEQEAIVQPLSAYDEKIETECKILQLYKRQKQFLLSQMFI